MYVFLTPSGIVIFFNLVIPSIGDKFTLPNDDILFGISNSSIAPQYENIFPGTDVMVLGRVTFFSVSQ